MMFCLFVRLTISLKLIVMMEQQQISEDYCVVNILRLQPLIAKYQNEEIKHIIVIRP